MYPNIAAAGGLFFEEAPAEAPAEFHLNYDEHLKPFVYGEIPEVDREIVTGHVETCADCRADLRDLLEFHRELEREKELAALSKRGFLASISEWLGEFRKPPFWLAFASVAAILGVAVWYSATRPKVAEIAARSGSSITAPALPELPAPEPTPAENSRPPEIAALAIPDFLRELRPTDRDETLRGGPTDSLRLTVTGPNGIALLGSQPILRWRPVPEASDYDVLITDSEFNRVAFVDRVTGSSWKPPALAKGRTYRWQVEARSTGSGRRWLGQGVFHIVGERAEARIAAAKDPVERGRALAEAGLFKEAAAELRRYLRNNPTSPIARNYLRQIERASR